MLNLRDRIDKALLEADNERSKRQRSGMWSPSSLGRCFRYQYWNRKNELATPVDDRTRRVFKCGNLFEEFAFKFLPEGVKTQVLCKVDDVLGYADIVTEDCVYDCKSQHSRAFHWMQKDGFDFIKDKLPNLLQVCFYAYALGKEKCGLIFISKDDLCIDERVFFTSKIQPYLDEELKKLRDVWAKQELPEADPRAYGGKECEYCGYHSKCLAMGFNCKGGKNVTK